MTNGGLEGEQHPTQQPYTGESQSGSTAYHPEGPTQQFSQPQPQASQQYGQQQPGYLQQAGFSDYDRRQRRSGPGVKTAFMTTEFWTFIVISVAILIASAVSDHGPSGLGGFGATHAWMFISWLAVAYILSRGLTKFGRRDRDDQDRNS